MIPLLIVGAGAAGAMLFLYGLPVLRKDLLVRRVEPYLGGLHGRPSRLLEGPRSRSLAARWMETRWPRGLVSLRDRLSAAGLDITPGEFRVEQIVWAVLGSASAIIFVSAAALGGAALQIATLPLAAVGAGASGFLARDWWLTRQAAARRERVLEELPVALDLITLSIMAGEAIPAAFARVASILGRGVGDELRRVVADVRAGAPLLDALESMKNEVPDYAVVRFVDALCTGIERGAPLSDVLRAQADDAREARRRALMEAGGRREILMLLPVVFLILPVVVMVALLPGLVSLDLLVP